MVGVQPPSYRPGTDKHSHCVNAFNEYLALANATAVMTEKSCKDILTAYITNNVKTLKGLMQAEGVSIFNNETGKVIVGQELRSHMVAYNLAQGFVPRDEDSGRFNVAGSDQLCVVTSKTKVFLDSTVVQRLGVMDLDSYPSFETEWVNGVPGCGKTTWIVNHFDATQDIIVTTTLEAARDVRARVTEKYGPVGVKDRVRTCASILVNGLGKKLEREVEEGNAHVRRLLFDEALMNHFGAVVAVAWCTGAEKVILIGDVNQIPYIDRQQLFQLKYQRPDAVANITRELLCTHRNPLDVSFALRQVYQGIYSSCVRLHSLKCVPYSGHKVPAAEQCTLYLVHTQGDKQVLQSQGYGAGRDSRVLTIHEAQGLTFDHVVIIRSTTKPLKIFDSVPHAVVAVSRHRKSCVYYSDVKDDAVGRFIALGCGSDVEIRNYNMAQAGRAKDDRTLLKLGDKTFVPEVREALKSSKPQPTTARPELIINNSTMYEEAVLDKRVPARSLPVSEPIPVISAVDEVARAAILSNSDGVDGGGGGKAASDDVYDKSIYCLLTGIVESRIKDASDVVTLSDLRGWLKDLLKSVRPDADVNAVIEDLKKDCDNNIGFSEDGETVYLKLVGGSVYGVR